jgi:hypothetical protein
MRQRIHDRSINFCSFYWTLIVTVWLCVSAPEVPVTITLYVPWGCPHQ